MLKDLETTKDLWCIVVADEHGPGCPIGTAHDRSPAQYCCLGSEPTPLRRALHRAASIAPSSQIILTALEEYRQYWEPAAWFIRPDRRFVGDNRWASQLSSAAAVLSVAARSPSSIVTILPAKCYVADEAVLSRALTHALSQLPAVPEGAVTLGMLDDRLRRCFRGTHLEELARHFAQAGRVIGSGRNCQGRVRCTCFARPQRPEIDIELATMAPAGIQTTRIWRLPQWLEQLEFSASRLANARLLHQTLSIDALRCYNPGGTPAIRQSLLLRIGVPAAASSIR
jgi:hypothetical protein